MTFFFSRLEHDKQMWESKAQTEVQIQQKVCDTLQGENKELLSQLEETQNLYRSSQDALAKLESELKILRDQNSSWVPSRPQGQLNPDCLLSLTRHTQATRGLLCLALCFLVLQKQLLILAGHPRGVVLD